ncbi:MAG TPA: hypothetical protein VND68_12060 [Chloroflexia bacterium]|nr:hypothetical protein [Chloroflexia bacterium]
MDVALVTYARLPDLDSDDRLLLQALRARGVNAGAAVWDDQSFDWSWTKLCVIRSTWDYHQRHADFMAWAEQAASVSQLWNPIEALRWNTHKGYLRDLAERDIPTVPTEWLYAGMTVQLQELLDNRGWQRAVLKPAVSASAYSTILVDEGSISEAQDLANRLLPSRDLMLQPFIESVETHGERSLIFIDGVFTHAVRRPSVLTDPEYAKGHGKYIAVEPATDEPIFGAGVLRAAGFPTLYARVDVVRDGEGKLSLMELELVEPSLWLAQSPGAVDRFAEGIISRLR